MKASMIIWIATMLYIVAGMVAIGFGAVASFGILIICAVLGAITAMNLMTKERGEKNEQPANKV